MKADLRKIERAARKAALARQELYEAVQQASQKGASLREIAKAADVSYETVRRIVTPA